MTDLNIYAFGHALIDEEYSVAEEFLHTHGITKHLRNPVTFEQIQTLRKKAAQHGKRHLKADGGSSANTIATASMLGAVCHYTCLLGNDDDGIFYLEQLSKSGIRCDINCLRDVGPTGLCLVLQTPDAARTMNTHSGVNAFIDSKDINFHELSNAEWLYIAGHLLNTENGFQASLTARDAARQMNKKIAVSFCDPAVVRNHHERLTQLLNRPIDLLFCNEEEARLWLNNEQQLNQFRKLDHWANQWVVTQGKNGACVFDGTNMHSVQADEVKAVSTLGAGDTFAGVFLYAITHDYSLVNAGRMACQAASMLVQQSGARLNSEQLQKVLANFQQI